MRNSILTKGWFLFIFFFALAVANCVGNKFGQGAEEDIPQTRAEKIAYAQAEGQNFSLLTYNVYGQPDVLSNMPDGKGRMKEISPKLNFYDIAVFQEDFAYNSQLVSQADHKFQSEPMKTSVLLKAAGILGLAKTSAPTSEKLKLKKRFRNFGESIIDYTKEVFGQASNVYSQAVTAVNTAEDQVKNIVKQAESQTGDFFEFLDLTFSMLAAGNFDAKKLLKESEFLQQTLQSLGGFGDGLNQVSNFAFSGIERHQWNACNGEDCATVKGFTYSKITLQAKKSNAKMPVHLYNVHFDAAGKSGDIAARNKGMTQILMHVATHGPDTAVIIAGDFNLRYNDPTDIPILYRLGNEAGLSRACAQVACDGDTQLDHVFYRSGSGGELFVTGWQHADEFVDSSGKDLSNHKALAVNFVWLPQ